jgi:hypothetical protein
MELLASFAILLAGGTFLLWRSRRANTSWRESRIAGLPADLRKNQAGDADTPSEREPSGSKVVGSDSMGGIGGFGGFGGGGGAGGGTGT